MLGQDFMNTDFDNNTNTVINTTQNDTEDYYEGENESYRNETDHAFSGGIDPGGLRNISDIRILVCYILYSVKAPISSENIIDICQQKAIANYFEVADAISALESRGCISRVSDISNNSSTYYKIETPGKAIAENLDVALPMSVRDKALEAAAQMLSEAKIEKENKVEIKKVDSGYNVTCHISGGDEDLMEFTLYVPDLYQARMVKRNFLRNPGETYKLILAAVTGNRDLAKSFLP